MAPVGERSCRSRPWPSARSMSSDDLDHVFREWLGVGIDLLRKRELSRQKEAMEWAARKTDRIDRCRGSLAIPGTGRHLCLTWLLSGKMLTVRSIALALSFLVIFECWTTAASASVRTV